MDKNIKSLQEIHIEPVRPWGFPDLKEVYQYRDLLAFLVWRTIKVSYAQSVGGYAWAIVQPTMQIVVFSVIFGGLIGLDGGEGVPYPLFATVAVIPWTYMQGTVTATSSALVFNAAMLTKVYFPRLHLLLTTMLSNFVPFLISCVLIVIVLVMYQVSMTINLLMLPVFVVLMMLTPLSFGLLLSTLAVRYRDVNIAMGSFLRMLIYIVPVMYPSDRIPDHLRDYYILNPFVGVIEGFKACLLGSPIQWDSFVTCTLITCVLLLAGSIYFRRMERIIVDVM
jgi:lipopolysaccharide transport system permease protein